MEELQELRKQKKEDLIKLEGEWVEKVNKIKQIDDQIEQKKAELFELKGEPVPAKKEKSKEEEFIRRDEKGGITHCTLCNVHVSGTIVWNQHRNGKKHRQNASKMFFREASRQIHELRRKADREHEFKQICIKEATYNAEYLQKIIDTPVFDTSSSLDSKQMAVVIKRLKIMKDQLEKCVKRPRWIEKTSD